LGAAAGQRGRRQPIKQWQPLMMMTMLSWTAQKKYRHKTTNTKHTSKRMY
jgi:hypothetical protein